jgi:ribosomal protein S21
MVIVQRKDADSIDKVLKNYRKKVEKNETIKILRNKMFFTKKCRKRSDERKLALYRQQLRSKDRDE